MLEIVADDAKKNGLSAEDSQAYVQKLSKINTSDIEYVVNKVVDFARERALLAAVRSTIEGVQSGKGTPGGVIKLFEEALQVGQNLGDLGYLFTKDSDKVIDKVTSKTYGLATGYPVLDKVWKRGWGPGWLIVPLAPPKSWKTTLAINLALNWISVSAAQPINVFYYPCEISQELAFMRAMLSFCGCNEDALYNDPEKFKELIRSRLATQCQGDILWKAFPAGQATIQDIRIHAKTACSALGIKPGAIIIDYAETVKPTQDSDLDRRQQAGIYTDARALGAEFNCPVILPERCNAETVDMAVPSMRSFQGAFQKAGIVDVGIGICATEEERLQNVLRLFIFLNRHGPAARHFRGKVDNERYTIDINEEIPYVPKDNEKKEKPAKEQFTRRPRLPSELED